MATVRKLAKPNKVKAINDIKRPPCAPTAVGLPDAPTIPSQDIRDYTMLLYAREKWGKSTFFSTFPGALFLCTEPGTKGLEIYSYNSETGVTSWEIFRGAVKALEQDTARFRNVVIDTLDEAYRMCFEYVCRQAGVSHPNDANDYGKTWTGITNEFAEVFRRIRATGRGLYMTSHARESEIESASGTKFHRISPSLTGKAGARVLALVDFIFYGEYFKDDKGQTRNVIVTRGDDLIVAGQRKIGGKGLPRYIGLPEDESDDYELFRRAFAGEVDGLDPAKLFVGSSTSKAGAGSHNQARLRRKRAQQVRTS